MDEVVELHAEVDGRARQVANAHQGRLQCRLGCSGCCEDDLTVFEIEAQRIRAHFPQLLSTGTPGPRGQCAFLDAEGACRIYAVRPYVCRTQGLPLRWVEEDGAERRSICPLNESGPDLVELPRAVCFELGPFEGRLATLQASSQLSKPGSALQRVPLRTLFASGEGARD